MGIWMPDGVVVGQMICLYSKMWTACQLTMVKLIGRNTDRLTRDLYCESCPYKGDRNREEKEPRKNTPRALPYVVTSGTTETLMAG